MAKNILVVMVVVGLIGVSLIGQAKPSIQGVWRVAERTTTGPNGATNKSPQPSLYIFAGKHYSTMYLSGDKPRALVQGIPAGYNAKVTDSQKMTRFDEWSALTANAGTYEVKGNLLTIHPLVAKNTEVMASKSGASFQLKFDGDSVWLTDVTTMGGTKVTQPTTIRLVRLE